MAKGNILLGTSAGSIGDVVLSRRNGRQVQRVRVREVSNPKTEAQGAQRMRMAAITRFYSPLSTCLEKAFEGKNRSESYSKYLSINARRAAADNFAVPKDGNLCPLPVQISAGTLPTPIVAYRSATDDGFELAIKAATAPTTLGELSTAIIEQYGLNDGDQITFVAVFTDGANYSVEYHRIFLERASTAALPTLGRLLLTGEVNKLNVADDNDQLQALGIVFSRWQAGKWRRSNSVMVCASTDFYGDAAYHQYIGDWTASASAAPAGTVYLDGQGSTDTVTMFLYTGTTPYVGDAITIASLGFASVPAAAEGTDAIPNVLVAYDTYGVAHPVFNANRRSDFCTKAINEESTLIDTVSASNAVCFRPYASDVTGDRAAYDEMFAWAYGQGIPADVLGYMLEFMRYT